MAKTKTSVRAAKKLLHFANSNPVAKKPSRCKYRELALKTKAAIANGFRNFLISKGLAGYNATRPSGGMAPFELTHIKNDALRGQPNKGVYTYSPQKSGDFRVTLADIIDNIAPSFAYDTNKVIITSFTDVSVRVRDGSGGCKTQVNVNPRVQLAITTDGVCKTVRLCHTDTRVH